MSTPSPSLRTTARSFFRKLFCCDRSPPPDQTGTEPKGNWTTLKVLTYNLQLLIGKNSDQKIDLILTSIREHPEIDLLCFQEVFLEEARRKLINGLRCHWKYYLAKVGKDSWLREDSGLMVFSQLPLSQPIFYRYHHSIGIDRLAEKGVILFTLDSRLRIANTHLQSDGTNWSPIQASESSTLRAPPPRDRRSRGSEIVATEGRGTCRGQSDYGGRTPSHQRTRGKQLAQISGLKTDLVLGDLNVPARSLEYRNMTLTLKKKDVFDFDPGPTHLDGDRRDYILVKPRYQVLDSQVLPFKRERMVKSTREEVYPSDHFGVYAEINLSSK